MSQPELHCRKPCAAYGWFRLTKLLAISKSKALESNNFTVLWLDLLSLGCGDITARRQKRQAHPETLDCRPHSFHIADHQWLKYIGVCVKLVALCHIGRL